MPDAAGHAAPPGSRIYAIGDIHGRVDLLRELHNRIAADADDGEERLITRHVVVYLGDYVDRGDGSREIIELIMERPPGHPLAGFEAVCLTGNHEELMLGFLEDTGVGSVWMANGAGATLASYGVDVAAGMAEAGGISALQQGLRRNLPEAHLAFLRALSLSHREGDYFFAHAGVLPHRALADQERDDLLWIRGQFLESDADHGACIVHGHSIVDRPEIHPNRIAIDTGAWRTGRLTCLVLEGGERRFLES
jgi:serine/threonine protein phosphatase 1